MRLLISIPCLYGPIHTNEAIESVVNTPAHLLLIDNGAEPKVKQVLEVYSKRDNVTVVSFPENVYVNPAWNHAIDFFLDHEFTHLILMNSDLIMHFDFYDTLSYLVEENEDFIGIPNIIKNRKELAWPLAGGSREQVLSGTPGVFVMMNQKQAHIVFPIPKEILVWFGDNWIYTILRKLGYKTFVLQDLKAFHYWSATVNKVVGIGELIEQDKLSWSNVVEPKMNIKINEHRT